jgi:hypothetical protein
VVHEPHAALEQLGLFAGGKKLATSLLLRKLYCQIIFIISSLLTRIIRLTLYWEGLFGTSCVTFRENSKPRGWSLDRRSQQHRRSRCSKTSQYILVGARTLSCLPCTHRKINLYVCNARGKNLHLSLSSIIFLGRQKNQTREEVERRRGRWEILMEVPRHSAGISQK